MDKSCLQYLLNTARFCQFRDVWGNKWSFCSEEKKIGTTISSWIFFSCFMKSTREHYAYCKYCKQDLSPLTNVLRYHTCRSSLPEDRKLPITELKWDARTVTDIPGNNAYWFFAPLNIATKILTPLLWVVSSFNCYHCLWFSSNRIGHLQKVVASKVLLRIIAPRPLMCFFRKNLT
jgi:hypothetical protein